MKKSPQQFRLMSRWKYSLYFFLLASLLYAVFALIFFTAYDFRNPEILIFTYGSASLLIIFHHSRTYYTFSQGYLHVRTPNSMFYTLSAAEIKDIRVFASPRFHFNGLYTLKITTRNHKHRYLYPENQEELVALLVAPPKKVHKCFSHMKTLELEIVQGFFFTLTTHSATYL